MAASPKFLVLSPQPCHVPKRHFHPLAISLSLLRSPLSQPLALCLSHPSPRSSPLLLYLTLSFPSPDPPIFPSLPPHFLPVLSFNPPSSSSQNHHPPLTVILLSPAHTLAPLLSSSLAISLILHLTCLSFHVRSSSIHTLSPLSPPFFFITSLFSPSVLKLTTANPPCSSRPVFTSLTSSTLTSAPTRFSISSTLHFTSFPSTLYPFITTLLLLSFLSLSSHISSIFLTLFSSPPSPPPPSPPPLPPSSNFPTLRSRSPTPFPPSPNLMPSSNFFSKSPTLFSIFSLSLLHSSSLLFASSSSPIISFILSSILSSSLSSHLSHLPIISSIHLFIAPIISDCLPSPSRTGDLDVFLLL
ncbi:mucin-2-like [Solenopsis invicta]|uniref:mucin-2-like n=1 Tax=Solenopsis invicta TaxID=13686 RepID=UPI00193C8D5C|nr:mucin-2-like [Solenopsis invicta]